MKIALVASLLSRNFHAKPFGHGNAAQANVSSALRARRKIFEQYLFIVISCLQIKGKMIKAVLFDYDGVLTLDKSGSYSICKYISKNADIDYELFSTEYKKYNDDLIIGKVTHEQIWSQLCKNINKNISIKYLFDSYKNTPINQKMIELVRKVKKNNKTGLITDNKKDRIDAAKIDFKLEQLFDVITVSAEIGSQKNTELIFNKTINQLGVKPDECIFIDNQESNLIVPKKMGIKTIFYDHKENNIKRLVTELKLLNISI
jgi:putative hydrolase of the HAD superfamily